MHGDVTFEHICAEVEKDYRNYKVYLQLGDYYAQKNVNQAWLCYENAVYFYGPDVDAESEEIKARMRALEVDPNWCVVPTSIVILSYNQPDMTKQCLESIRKHNPQSAYELVIVDNASDEETRQYLGRQDGIKLLFNEENQGFPKGCNQGIEIAKQENDIFLLNNDTVMMPNSLFWLRMGLYEDAKVGAVGSRSNHAVNYQAIEERFTSLADYEDYAIRHNVPMAYPYEEKNWLQGYAMLIKRGALEEVGLLDTRFSPGNYEDNDLGYRLKSAGYALRLCYNSFIFHYGNGGGSNTVFWNPVLIRNKNKFEEKWGFSEDYYVGKRLDIMRMISHEKSEPIRVLDVGCALGVTMAAIQHMWPKAEVYGIESEEKIAQMAGHTFDVLQGDIEQMILPYETESFDYIIFADVLEQLHDPQRVLSKLMPYLKKDGRFLCSISNFMHAKVLSGLIKGQFEYENAGILDKKNIRFFTLDSFCKMASECGMEAEYVMNSFVNLSQEEEKLVQYMEGYSDRVADPARFRVYKYLLRMRIR